MIYFLIGMTLVAAAALFNFFFSPASLGPEPSKTLPDDFFTRPPGPLSSLRLLAGGAEAFDAILDVIEKARESVVVQAFIWRDDEIGRKIAAALIAAADRGVKVSINRDMAGVFFELGDILRGRPSPALADRRLKNHPNITISARLSADTDHGKYYIADGRRAVLGGMNIADEYHRKWRDFMVMMDSPEWAGAFERKVVHGAPWPDNAPFFIAANTRSACEIRRAVLQTLGRAQRSIVMDHAYFSGRRVMDALEQAARRKVMVDVILPREPDTHRYANWAAVNRLLSSCPADRLRVHFYPAMSHAKMMLVDDSIAITGSANLTHRSLRRSREVALFARGAPDDPFIARIRDEISAAMAESDDVTELIKLGLREKIGAFLGRWTW